MRSPLCRSTKLKLLTRLATSQIVRVDMNAISNREISLGATIAGIKAATSEQPKFLSIERDVALLTSHPVSCGGGGRLTETLETIDSPE
jgi:hypothetical protein